MYMYTWYAYRPHAMLNIIVPGPARLAKQAT